MSVEQGLNKPISTEPWVGILGDGADGVPDSHPLSQLTATYDQAPTEVLGFLRDPLVAEPTVEAYENSAAARATQQKQERAPLSARERATVQRIHGALLSATVETSQGPRIILDYDNETSGAQRQDPDYMDRLHRFQETRNGSPYLEENRRRVALGGLRVFLERRGKWHTQEGITPVIPLDALADAPGLRVPEQRRHESSQPQTAQPAVDLRPAV